MRYSRMTPKYLCTLQMGPGTRVDKSIDRGCERRFGLSLIGLTSKQQGVLGAVPGI